MQKTLFFLNKITQIWVILLKINSILLENWKYKNVPTCLLISIYANNFYFDPKMNVSIKKFNLWKLENILKAKCERCDLHHYTTSFDTIPAKHHQCTPKLYIIYPFILCFPETLAKSCPWFLILIEFKILLKFSEI